MSRSRPGRPKPAVAGRPDAGSSPSRRTFLAGATAAIGACIVGARGSARAAGSYPRLSDRTVTLLVGNGVGGGYDLCGRVMARHMELAVPGLRIEIKNVTQGSGRLAGKMLQEGPTDGSMLFTSGSSLLAGQLLREEGVAYDLRQWGWLGTVAAETYVMLKGPGADFATLAELKAKKSPSSMSVSSIVSSPSHQALWLNAMLGLHINPVPGYKSIEKDTAMTQGEVMITSGTWPNDRQMMEAEGVDVFLKLTSGEMPERYSDRPLLADLVSDRPSYLPIVRFMQTTAELHRWFSVPPNTDPSMLAEWRNLFDAVVSSESFISDMARLDFDVDPMNGQKVSDVVNEALADVENQSAVFQAALECGQAMADNMDASCANT